MKPVQTNELELVNGGSIGWNVINVASITASQTNVSVLSLGVLQSNSISVTQSN